MKWFMIDLDLAPSREDNGEYFSALFFVLYHTHYITHTQKKSMKKIMSKNKSV